MNKAQPIPIFPFKQPKKFFNNILPFQDLRYHTLSMNILPFNYYHPANQPPIRQIQQIPQYIYGQNMTNMMVPKINKTEIIVIDSDDEETRNKQQTSLQNQIVVNLITPPQIYTVENCQKLSPLKLDKPIKTKVEKQKKIRKQKKDQVAKKIEQKVEKIEKELKADQKILDLDQLERQNELYDDDHKIQKKNKIRRKRDIEKYTIGSPKKLKRLQKFKNQYIRDEEVLQNLIEEEKKLKLTKVGPSHQAVIEANPEPQKIRMIKKFTAKKISNQQCQFFLLFNSYFLVEDLLSKLKNFDISCNDEDVVQLLQIAHNDYEEACKLLIEQNNYFKEFFINLHQILRKYALDNEFDENYVTLAP